MLNAVGYKEVNKMRAEDFSRLSSQGVLIFEDQKRIEIPLENGGRIVGYFPLDGVQIYAFDIRGGAVPDLTLLGLRQPERGRFLRTNSCRSGSCEFVKNGRSAVLMANEACLDYGYDNVPMMLNAKQYVGVETILQIDKVLQNNSIYMLLRQTIISMHLLEMTAKEDFLYYLSMSATTQQEMKRLTDYCLSEAAAVLVIIKVAELGYWFCCDLQGTNSMRRTFVNRSQLAVAQDIHNSLSESCDQKWTASYFAEKYGFSTTTVKKWFKNVYGYGFKEYQVKTRMDEAVRMLRDSDLSVGEIAQRVGYSSHAKFGVMFKEKYGITPLEYRRKSRVAQIIRKERENGEE